MNKEAGEHWRRVAKDRIRTYWPMRNSGQLGRHARDMIRSTVAHLRNHERLLRGELVGTSL